MMSTPVPYPAVLCDLTIAVPCLNEEGQIGGTLAALGKVCSTFPAIKTQVIVIDDGSSDKTSEVVRNYAQAHPEVSLIVNPRNMGLGSSIKASIRNAAGRRLLIVPGDNDLPEEALSALVGHSKDADLVMCYFLNNEVRGQVRNLISTAFGLIYTACFDIYPQYINGPCVYPVGALRELDIFSTRFSIVAELNVKLLRRGVSFMEVASVRQVGLEGSTSFSLRNLLETATVFFRLLYEIHIRNSAFYAKRPVRIFGNVPR